MAHLYKVDADKAFKILMATSPKVIFINGIRFSEIDSFVERFKNENVNLMHLDTVYKRLSSNSLETMEEIRDYFAECEPTVEKTLDELLINELKAYVNRSKTTCIIAGNLGNVNVIQKSLGELFTYVYIYPNSEKLYKESVNVAIDSCTDSSGIFYKVVSKKDKKGFSKNLDVYIEGQLTQRKKIFKKHKEFLGRALVILDK